jgi:peptidoglycan/LPS O-acetylase OafA/YrhL
VRVGQRLTCSFSARWNPQAPGVLVIAWQLFVNTIPYILISLGIAFLFKLTKDSSLDANIGELSYPIYMCHILVIALISRSMLDTLLIGWPEHALTIVLVMVTAFLLDRLIVLPIDKLRIRFGGKARIESRFFEPSSTPSTSAVNH